MPKTYYKMCKLLQNPILLNPAQHNICFTEACLVLSFYPHFIMHVFAPHFFQMAFLFISIFSDKNLTSII